MDNNDKEKVYQEVFKLQEKYKRMGWLKREEWLWLFENFLHTLETSQVIDNKKLNP